MSFQCPICQRTFSRRSGYGYHVQACTKRAEMFDEECSEVNENEEHNEVNEDEEHSEVNEVNTQSIDNEERIEVECEVDSNTEAQGDISFNSIETEMSTMSLDSLESDTSESEDTLELELDTLGLENFPNDAYKDLMILITKNKLSNKAGDDIIKFFNKHSNLATSPLPKNIKKGHEFMDNMKISSALEFNKIVITRYNDKDYFLYYQNLINCVKNILAVPDITKDFALSFESYKVECHLIYQMIFNIFIFVLYLFYSIKEKVLTKSKILLYGGRLRKNPYLLVLAYYQLYYIRMLRQRTH